MAERTVTNQLYRYEELLALHLADETRLCKSLKEHKQVILALDGLQPNVGHEVLWVLRDCCSGEVLVARSLLGATEKDLVPLLEEAANLCRTLSIPIKGGNYGWATFHSQGGGERTAGHSSPTLPFPLPARGRQTHRRC